LELSISNGTFSKLSLQENIAMVKQLGFKNVEFNMKSVEVEDDISIYNAKNLIQIYGLRCLTLHSAVLHVKDEVEVHRAVYYGKVSLEFARLLQAKVMVVHSNVSRKMAEPRRHRILASVFAEISDYAENLNVKLALENLSYASSGYGKNVSELEEIFRIVDEERRMGFTLDYCHAEATGQTFDLLEKYHNQLSNVHVSNRAHKPFETGNSRLDSFIAKLLDYGYTGPLTLELSRKCSNEMILKTKAVLEDTLISQIH